MSLFKRISTTLFSQVDRVVSEIENHDAIIEAAIRDNQRALAKAKVRFNRLQADGSRLRQRLGQLQTAEQQWSRRAQDNADSDQSKALQCLQKRRGCRQQIASIESAVIDQENAEARLSKDITTVEERLRKINQQRNLMRTRESAADAMRSFNAIQGCCGIDIDDTFEKWETKVLEAELVGGDFQPTDDLEQQFIDDEELDDLQAELDALTRGEQL